jgi:hypothetical protein
MYHLDSHTVAHKKHRVDLRTTEDRFPIVMGVKNNPLFYFKLKKVLIRLSFLPVNPELHLKLAEYAVRVGNVIWLMPN